MSHLVISVLICLRASCLVMVSVFLFALYKEPSGALAAAGLSVVISLIFSLPLSCLIALVVGSTFSLPYKFTSCLAAFMVLASAIPSVALFGFLNFIGHANDFNSSATVFFIALPIIGIGCLTSQKGLQQIYDQQQLAAGAQSKYSKVCLT